MRSTAKRRYVVKRIENRFGCGRTETTWDVLLETRDGFEHLAECVRRSHALTLARALNGRRRRGEK